MRDLGIQLYTVSLHIDLSLAEATVVVADIVQTELAGYSPWVQWPIEEQRLLLPVVVEGEAVWRDPRTGRSVAPIGHLTDRTTRRTAGADETQLRDGDISAME